jgi:hypothetical protein
MSTDTAFLSMALPAECVPQHLSSLEDAAPLWNPDSGFAGSSRNDWLGRMFAKLVADYQANGLAHLLARATCLSPAMVEAGIADAQALLTRWLSGQRELVRITEQDYWSDDEILGFLKEAVTLDPYFDDGDVLPYLIACLKAHLKVLETARDQGMVVVHARSSAVG